MSEKHFEIGTKIKSTLRPLTGTIIDFDDWVRGRVLEQKIYSEEFVRDSFNKEYDLPIKLDSPAKDSKNLYYIGAVGVWVEIETNNVIDLSDTRECVHSPMLLLTGYCCRHCGKVMKNG
jgi:hypothetical protein